MQIYKFGIWKIRMRIFTSISVCCLVIGMLSGCTRDYVRQLESYYQQAIGHYQDLINQGNDLDRLYLELGQLYYSHGDFQKAIEAFAKTNHKQAKKFMAISYYRLGNFTDALEIFNKYESFSELRHKQKIHDTEYLYYYGLTCEKLNLFDDALSAYKKIRDEKFKARAVERINSIEKQAKTNLIKDVNPQIYKIITQAPLKEHYPQAGALILSCQEEIEITSDGKQISYLHYLVKILNERGKEAFSETHIDYDSTYEKVELEYARTIKPDGEVVEVGSRNIRDVSKYLNFPLYSNVRVYIISFPEITEGSTIEYKVKIYDNQLINKKDFILTYPVQASEPIIMANFSLSLPKTTALHIKFLNEKYNNFGANLNPDIKEKEGRLIYNWRFKDIPQIIPESNMPPAVQINPTILISTFSSWQDIYKWWSGLSASKINADDAIKDKVRQLIRNQDSQEARIRAIYNFCAKEIRYVAVEYGQAGYEPHYAGDIFKNKYGDCKDQAVLLVTMLKEAGISSWLVLIATREYYNLNEDFPSVLFNHCIAVVSFKDKLIFLDPTAQTCPFGDLPTDDQGRKVLIFKEEGYKIEDTPLYPAEHNLVKEEINIEVNNDESIRAQKYIFTYGVYDQAQRFWLLYTPPELIEEALKEKIQEISIGSTLDKYNINNINNLNEPIVLSYAFRGQEYFTVAGDLRIMPQLSGLDTSLVAKDKRKYAIDFSMLDSKETYLEIVLSDTFVVKYMPDKLSEDSQWLKFIVEYEQQGNKLFFNQKLYLKKKTISENEYPEFKKFFEGLAKKIKQRIVFEKAR